MYEKANSMTAETIECPGWMHRFLIGKNGSNLRELIDDNEKVLVLRFFESIICIYNSYILHCFIKLYLF